MRNDRNQGNDWNHGLEDLGWDDFFEKKFIPCQKKGWVPFRVSRVEKDAWFLLGENTQLIGRLSGKLRFHAEKISQRPALGDWVAVKVSAPSQGFIQQVLPRKSVFSRKEAGLATREQVISANIDYAFIVTAMDQDFHPRRIERYLTLCQRSQVKGVVVINKEDLAYCRQTILDQLKRINDDLPIHFVSAKEETGLESLMPYLSKGKTVTLIGSSGVGKSSLVNAITHRALQKVSEVRAYDHRGRHTTTHREMILLTGGGIIVDNPGMREIQLWADEDSLDSAFSDIEAFAKRCQFTNCAHEQEPGCEIRVAIEEGKLPRERWENYQKMLREIRFLEKRQRARGRYP